MQPKNSTKVSSCDCGSSLPFGKAGSQERFEHNTTIEHRLAVLRQTGAPPHVIGKVLNEHRLIVSEMLGEG